MKILHYKKDIWLITVLILQLGFLVASFLLFEKLSWPFLVVLALTLIYFYCLNAQCVAHNFIHKPFFRIKSANFVFSAINTFGLGMPQCLYRQHHLEHHKYVNDKWQNGQRPKDSSSFYLYGKNGEPENIWAYSFLSPFRADAVGLAKEAVKAGNKLNLITEVSLMIFIWVMLLIIAPKYFLMFFLPVWYLGQVSEYLENYLEHHKADVSNSLTDSVSCYDTFYNFLWFNNGYHQEHHCYPSIHWSDIPKAKAKMLPEAQRRVVKGSHLGGLFQ